MGLPISRFPKLPPALGSRLPAYAASTPCQLRVTSFARKCRLVDRHPLYVPARAAPHVRASHYGLRLAHNSGQYDRGPKITTTDWQTRSAGDEEVTTSKPRGVRWLGPSAVTPSTGWRLCR